MELDGEWRMTDFDPGAGEAAGACAPDLKGDGWVPARVPGDVHASLLEAGRIPDPFYDRNVETVQWVETREWWFRRTFRALARPHHPEARDLLVFDGLDTCATVYLNGTVLGEHANMFRPAVFDVTGRLANDERNTLAVRFDPVRSRIAGRVVDGQWGGYGIERVFARKTQCQFSWDWAPRLVNVGLWRGVRLERFRTARLHWPYLRTLAADSHCAIVTVGSEVEVWGDPRDLEMEARLSRQGSSTAARVPIAEGAGHICLSLPRPALWWPRGYGDQALYELEVTLRRGEAVLDRYHDRVGLRTVGLERNPDPEEVGAESFTFLVNGVPVFAKGANWIPADCLNGRVDRARYERLLDLFRDANGNMLRVWGGGQYEKDDFYRLADETGVLVWQDFMFACGRYPDDEEFVEEVRAEAEYQVCRLRNHPCVAIWVGNNENDWIEDATHWEHPGRDFPGKDLYHRHLPEIVGRVDPGRPYWPSSPYGGNDHNGEHAGDRHNWHVWHGGVLPRRFGDPPQHDPSPAGVSYRHYSEDTARFISEFGMHAAPVLETLRRNVPEEGLYLGSQSLLFRNRDEPKDKGNALMTAHTGLPRSLDEYIDFSMMCQAEGLKHGIEHYRRRKWHCSGTLFWQWNDCWPGISWSVVDYYGFPKAAYFFAKRAYAPVLVSMDESPEGVGIWVTNDLLSSIEETLVWTHATFDGDVLSEQETNACIPANSAGRVAVVPWDHLGAGPRRDQVLWVEGKSGKMPANRHFFAEPKDLARKRPEVSIAWEEQDSVLLAHLTSDRHAYFMHLLVSREQVRYSDNWFDIFPGRSRTVRMWSEDGRRISPDTVAVSWR